MEEQEENFAENSKNFDLVENMIQEGLKIIRAEDGELPSIMKTSSPEPYDESDPALREELRDEITQLPTEENLGKAADVKLSEDSSDVERKEDEEPSPVENKVEESMVSSVQEDETVDIPVTEDPIEDVPEVKLRDSEKYGIFFKMLRMGVPMPAVKNKMIQKAINPNVLDLGEESYESKANQLEKAYENEQRQLKIPKKKGEAIHWEAIPDNRLVNKETVFLGTDFELDKNTLVHVQDLLELFKRAPVDPEKGEEKQTIRQAMVAKMKMQRIDSVLDSRRAQAISIAMKKLKISPDQPAKFTWALREMNEAVINAQAVEVLLSCPLWPVNEEELHVLKMKSESGDKLAEPDRLILFVIESVPDVATRVNALAFRWEFEASIVEAIKAAADVKVAAKEILANSNLKLIVRSAILVGNAINEESGIQIRGCTLNSLIKLGLTKTVRDKNTSVLDCVAGYCMRCYPDFASVSELIPMVLAAKKVELETQIKSVRDMRRGVEAVRKMRQLEAFAFDAMRRLDTVESEMGVARDFYDRCLGYFGMPKGEMDTNIFFDMLYQFFDMWGKSVVKRQREVKSAAAAVIAAAAAKKAAEKASLRAAEKAEKEKQKAEDAEFNKGRLRLTVQLKGLFVRKQGNGEKIVGMSSQDPLPSPRGERKQRRSIFQKDSAQGVMRPKGRKSVFWGNGT